MLPRADAGAIVPPVTAIQPIPAVIAVGDTRLQGASRLDQFAIGQQLQAKVVSLFQDGSALVRIGETAARMTLPPNARAGSSVMLTLTSKDPRPTFSMQVESEEGDADAVSLSGAGRQMPGGSAANAALTAGGLGVDADGGKGGGAGGIDIAGPNVAGARAAAAAAALTTAQNSAANASGAQASTNITLSRAGQLINNLQQAQPDHAPAVITGHSALAASPNVSAQQMTGALRDSVEYSGVFYESHVSEWAEGKRDLGALLREPQAMAAQGAQASQAGDAIKTAVGADPLAQPGAATTEIGKIVNMQLNALDQQRIVWQGEVWPGQQMQWEINREADDRSNAQQQSGDEAPAMWQSVVRFSFEHLGTVSASIRLYGTGQQIQMQLRTDNEATGNALRAHGGELVDAMAAAGTSLDSLTVKRDGPA